MHDLKKLLSTGCFFLCLGGWVCDGRAIGADSPAASKDALLNAAVAAAAVPGSLNETTPTTNPTVTPQPAPVVVAPTVTAAPAPTPDAPAATTAPAADAGGASTNLNSAVVNVGVDGMVEQFNAQDLDINTALHFLSLQSKRNIIASKDVKGTVTANLYNVTFTEALDSLLKPNGFDYVEKGNFIYVYTTKELEDIRKRDRKTVNHIFQLHYVNAGDASVLIKPMLSANGALALTPPSLLGLSTGATDTGGMNYSTDDMLVINDYPENITDIDKALREIDVRPKQVLIESTILNAQLSDNNALGVDIVSLSGLDFGSILDAVGGSNGTSGAITTPRVVVRCSTSRPGRQSAGERGYGFREPGASGRLVDRLPRQSHLGVCPGAGIGHGHDGRGQPENSHAQQTARRGAHRRTAGLSDHDHQHHDHATDGAVH